MSIPQDTWNKLVTAYLLIVFTVGFFLSYFMNKPIDLVSYAAASLPVLSQILDLIHNVVINNAAVSAANTSASAAQVGKVKQVLTTPVPSNGMTHE